MFKVPFFSTISPNQAQECPKKVSPKTSKRSANQRVQRLSKETRLQLAKGFREKMSPQQVLFSMACIEASARRSFKVRVAQ
jgi:hypothetical protein